MRIKDVTNFLETVAPLAYQEKYDNAGLIIGDSTANVARILVCLDITENVLEEAITTQCELVVAHHPIVFHPLKKITGKNYVERIVIKAIKNDIALYAVHTNLDNVLKNGVSSALAQTLGLKNIKILAPKSDLLNQLVVFVPRTHKEILLTALYAAGAGNIGDYKNCSFVTLGEGEFTPHGTAQPFIGALNQSEKVEEARIEVIFPAHLSERIIAAMQSAHPYETVAYYLQTLKNTFDDVGSGVIGTITPTLSAVFLEEVKQKTGAQFIKHTPIIKKTIETVALCGGSGRFLLETAIGAHADIFISADFKYHDYFEADGKIIIADIGHYESEQHTIGMLRHLISKQFSDLSVNTTSISTNPIIFL